MVGRATTRRGKYEVAAIARLRARGVVSMISGIGPMEVGIVLVIALLVLGPKRLPAAGRSLGQGLREFKDGVTGQARSDDRSALEPASHERSA